MDDEKGETGTEKARRNEKKGGRKKRDKRKK